MFEDIPQWAQLLGGAIGVVVIAIATRLGWTSSKNPTSNVDKSHIAGVVVDPSTIGKGTEAIQRLTTAVSHLSEQVEQLKNIADQIHRDNEIDRAIRTDRLQRMQDVRDRK